jgi:pimeloyl-ACP methyl ester carboxylesterase
MIETTAGSLRVRQAGDSGPHLVFAADPPNVLEQYDALFAELAPWARVAALELPGFGFSVARAGFDFSLTQMARAVGEALDALGSGPFTLAFPCVSGFVALELARARPDQVRFLCLMQTSSWQDLQRWAARVDPRGLLKKPGLGQLLMALRKRQVARGWYAVAAGDPEMARALTAATESAFDHGAGYCLASVFQALAGAAAPVPVAVPGLVAWGKRDRTHRKSAPSGILPHLEAGTLHQLDVGHFPELEAPAQLAALLRAAISHCSGAFS